MNGWLNPGYGHETKSASSVTLTQEMHWPLALSYILIYLVVFLIWVNILCCKCKLLFAINYVYFSKTNYIIEDYATSLSFSVKLQSGIKIVNFFFFFWKPKALS